jgi:hypothetical protein
MAWPEALTTNADVLKYAHSQGVTRILESGNDFTELHKGCSERVKNWLQANRWPDADQISNYADFKQCAVFWFLYLVLVEEDRELADRYKTEFYASINNTNAEVVTPHQKQGGTFGFPKVIKQSRNRPYTSWRSGAIYKQGRNL